MSDLPNFIPETLDLNGSWDETLAALYDIFKRDFIERPLYYREWRVFHDRRKDDSGKEEGFWHLITKNDPKEGRLPDFDRAKRLPWARPLIENLDEKEVVSWDYIEGNKKIRTYIWLRDHDYVVILEKGKNNIAFIITAFYVDGESRRRNLKKKYEQRIK